MCGIVGIAGHQAADNREWLAIARDSMQHRGPDDKGEWWSDDRCVGLGHRRLAIVDLSQAGHQPMSDPMDELSIVFNGEIYNFVDLRAELMQKGHIFRSHSDTEVILAAYREWGSDCLSRFNGMFAFALYDSRQRQLFIARDRAGEKPLFYSAHGGQLRFASELKALVSDPKQMRRVDMGALDCYLAMGFVPGERCMLQNVNKLPPAHAMRFEVQTGRLRVWRYWDLPELEISAQGDGQHIEAALLEELEYLLEDAVRLQLSADVPVGILLSGGVDSSLITAMAARTRSKVKTFTVRFSGHGKYDETQHARLIAQHFGTEHVELESVQTIVELLPRLARQVDEPMVDSSLVPTHLVCTLIRKHCTVALGGDGGDELFGGYMHYSRLLWMRQNVDVIPSSWRRWLGQLGGAALPVGAKGRHWVQSLMCDLDRSLPMTGGLFDPGMRRKLMAHCSLEPVAEVIREERIVKERDLIQRATRTDFENYLAEDVLVKVDRASMLNSLEVRAPFLDYRILNFAFRKVPSNLKATARNRKLLLKRLATRILPPQFDQRRKQGFSIPLNSLLRLELVEAYFRTNLLDGESASFNRHIVKHLLNSQARGLANGERLFALLMFELWRREYDVSI